MTTAKWLKTKNQGKITDKKKIGMEDAKSQNSFKMCDLVQETTEMYNSLWVS